MLNMKSTLIILGSIILTMLYKHGDSQDITTGLIAHYKFEVNSTTVVDETGNHDGTRSATGVTLDTDGKIGNAYNFNGTSGNVTIPGNSSNGLNPVQFTLCYWFKSDGPQGNYDRLSGFSGYDYEIAIGGSTPKLRIYYGAWYITAITFAPGEWNHIATTYDGSVFRVYVNGTEVKTITRYRRLSGNLYLASQYNGGENFDGSMDETRMYNRALTANDIMELYNTENEASLVNPVTSVNTYKGNVELNLNLVNDYLYVSGNTSGVYLPYGHSNITSIEAGDGITGGGSSATVSLSADKDNAIWNANQIQDIPIEDFSSLQQGQVLKYINNKWTPSDDSVAEVTSPIWNTQGSDIYIESGNVGIGTDICSEKLTVDGKILSKEVIIDLNIPAPDYVFNDDYVLQSLEDLDGFLKRNKHLPDIPSGKEIKAEGVNIARLNMMLLKRIEELTLHIIEQEKRLQSLENKNN